LLAHFFTAFQLVSLTLMAYGDTSNERQQRAKQIRQIKKQTGP
jgi:hypothetical protein